MRLYLTILCFILFVNANLFSNDIEFSEIPQNLQFYARNENNKAIIPISGKVFNKLYDSIKVKVYRNNIPFDFVSKDLKFVNDTVRFNVSVTINSELAEYKIAVYLDNLLLTTRDSIVAGDVYLINGQSNSHPYGNISYKNEYWRSFGKHTNTDDYNPADTSWGLANGWGWYSVDYGVGTWGIELQRLITTNYQIPVFILNGGSGGSSIEYNQPDASNRMNLTTTYGRLLYRAVKAKLADKVKAVFWHQGESNSYYYHTNYEYYFDVLYRAWKQDFPNIKKVYVFQIRHGCGGDNQKDIREYQRKFSQKYPDISTMSTVGLDGHDGCHYTEAGYNQMASWIYRYVARDFYSSNDTLSIKPPDIIRAYYLNKENTKVGLDFSEEIIYPQDFKGYSLKDYFYFDDESGMMISGASSGPKSVILTINPTKTYKKITYTPNLYYNNTTTIYQGPWLKNIRGVGAFTFYNLDIQAATYFTKHPSSQNFCNSIAEVNLDVSVSGQVKYFAWQKYDESSKTWFDIPNTNYTKIKFNLNASTFGAGKYRCVITKIQDIKPDTLISDEAIIQIFKPISNLSILNDNIKSEYCAYDSLNIYAFANGNMTKCFLQKEISGKFTDIDSVNCNYQNSLTYTKLLKPGDSGKYRLSGYGASDCGTTPVNSIEFYLKVNDGLTVTTKFDSITVCKNSSMNLGVTASDKVISYIWLKDNKTIDSNTNTSAKTSDLTIDNVKSSDAGIYQCVVKSKFCDTIKSIYSDKIYVKINSSQEITNEIIKNEYQIGDNANLKIETLGLDGVLITWFRNGIVLKNDDKYNNCNTHTLTIKNLDKADFNSYYYATTEYNGCKDTSSIFYLKRSGTIISITEQVSNISNCIGEASELKLLYNAENCDSLMFKWYFENKEITPNESIEINKSNLKILNTSKINAGSYNLEITALPGNIKITSKPIILTVNDLPKVVTQSKSEITVDETRYLELFVNVDSGILTKYQWYKDNKLINGSILNSFLITNTKLIDAGTYYCEISNKCGITKSNEFKVKVNPAISVRESTSSEIEINPNPANYYILIQLSKGIEPTEVSNVQIYDVLGIMVRDENFELLKNTQKIDISNLPAGVYFVKVGTWFGKFVKV